MFDPSLPPRKKKKRKGERTKCGGRNGSRGGEREKTKGKHFNKVPLSFLLKTHQPPLQSLSKNGHRSLEPNKLLVSSRRGKNLIFDKNDLPDINGYISYAWYAKFVNKTFKHVFLYVLTARLMEEQRKSQFS